MKHYGLIFLALLVLLVLYYNNFSAGPYVDDNSLIFGNAFIRAAHNPLQYWYRGQNFTRTWPLTHTLYWLQYQCFGLHFTYYRCILLILHWLNGALLFYFLRKKNPSAALFAACVFWFHPMTVEVVTWITQIGTLLSTLFFAFWARNLEEKPLLPAKLSFLILLGMMASKGYAYLLAPLEIFKNQKELGWKKSFVREIPAILLSAYAIFLAGAGVYYRHNESRVSQNYFKGAPAPIAPPIVNTPPPKVAAPLSRKPQSNSKKTKLAKKKKAEPAVVAPVVAPPVIAPTPPPANNSTYAGDQLNPQSAYEKISLVGRSSIYYLVKAFCYKELLLANPAFFSEWNPAFFLFALALVGLFLFALYKQIWLLAAFFCTYLPVSGFFYIPFQKYGTVADRVVYLPLFLLAWGMGKLYVQTTNLWLRRALWAWPLVLFLMTIFTLQLPRGEFPIPQ